MFLSPHAHEFFALLLVDFLAFGYGAQVAEGAEGEDDEEPEKEGQLCPNEDEGGRSGEVKDVKAVSDKVVHGVLLNEERRIICR